MSLQYRSLSVAKKMFDTLCFLVAEGLLEGGR
jgi:hypothetical protein